MIAAIAWVSVATSVAAADTVPPAPPPPTSGTISIESRPGDASGASLSPFVDAAAAVLIDRGFAVLPTAGHAAYVMEVVVSRSDVGTGLAKVPAGAASALGAGVSIPLSNGGSQLMTLRRTRLEMRLRKRVGAGIVWDGVAVTVRAAGTRKGAPDAVAADLSRALFRSYPGQSKQIVGVP
jgi:hypothetical protein